MSNADIHFYFDPVCPFAWMTSKWVRIVQAQRVYGVDWRFISLRLINATVDYDRHFPVGYEAGHTACPARPRPSRCGTTSWAWPVFRASPSSNATCASGRSYAASAWNPARSASRRTGTPAAARPAIAVRETQSGML